EHRDIRPALRSTAPAGRGAVIGGVVVTNRRQFIQSSLALSAAGLPAVRAWASSASAIAGEPTLHRVGRSIYDGGFLEGEDVAVAAADGATAVRIEGDLTALWYHDLGPAWKRAPMTIAGITAWHGLFVLETLAADHGMRVVYRGEHKI